LKSEILWISGITLITTTASYSCGASQDHQPLQEGAIPNEAPAEVVRELRRGLSMSDRLRFVSEFFSVHA